jgi:hypothetical protein
MAVFSVNYVAEPSMTLTISSDSSSDTLLFDRALPVIDTVVGRRCHYWTVANDLREDVRAEVLMRLVKRLRDPESAPIAGFDEYVAGVTSRVIDDAIRAAAPEWARLKHRVRYVLDHDDRFRVTLCAGGQLVCSLQPSSLLSRRRVRSYAADALARTMIDVLRHGEHERPIDDLVNAVAERTGVADAVRMSGHRFAPSRAAEAETALESADYLGRLWSEIVELPRRQRLALLFNARDAAGDSVLQLLISEAIVSSPEAAAAVEVAEEELRSLLGRLPLMDAEIAESLQVTRQQVINLRSAARDRLARRMARTR